MLGGKVPAIGGHDRVDDDHEGELGGRACERVRAWFGVQLEVAQGVAPVVHRSGVRGSVRRFEVVQLAPDSRSKVGGKLDKTLEHVGFE